MYFVYLIRLSNNQFYVGFSQNIKERFAEHQDGKCQTTSKYRPLKLVWCCMFSSKKKALAFEKYLKSGSGVEFRIRHLI